MLPIPVPIRNALERWAKDRGFTVRHIEYVSDRDQYELRVASVSVRIPAVAKVVVDGDVIRPRVDEAERRN